MSTNVSKRRPATVTHSFVDPSNKNSIATVSCVAMPLSPQPSEHASFADSTRPSHEGNYTFSTHSSKRRRSHSTMAESNGRSGKPRWLNQMKNWLSTSEPSAQALKSQRLSTYHRHGVDLKDPDAAAKMHLPIGKVPNGVTSSTTGPSPERILKERARRAMDRAEKHNAYTGHAASASVSSGISSGSSSRGTKEARLIAPWAER